jgi:hypothetical protein
MTSGPLAQTLRHLILATNGWLRSGTRSGTWALQLCLVRAQTAKKAKTRCHSNSELAASYSWGKDASVMSVREWSIAR